MNGERNRGMGAYHGISFQSWGGEVKVRFTCTFIGLVGVPWGKV